ncbi:MAG: zinc metalloprotease HtpX [Sulfolobaceae archaeon]
MIIAGILAAVAEGIITYFLLSFFNLPFILIYILLPLFWLVQWILGPYLVGRRATEIGPNDVAYGWVYNIVKEIAEKSKIKPPRVFISDDPFPNAFAYGNYITGKRVAITRPLLNILTDEELKAVIAHEIGHIKHFDVEIGMAIGLIPSALGFISNLLLNFGWIALLFAVDEYALLLGIIMIAVGFLLLALTILINIFVLWFNRLRESYADYHAVTLFKSQAWNLATALAKIQIYMQNVRVDPFTGIILTVPPMKIRETDPNELLNKWLNQNVSPFADVLMTHPHPARRVQLIYKLAFSEVR